MKSKTVHGGLLSAQRVARWLLAAAVLVWATGTWANDKLRLVRGDLGFELEYPAGWVVHDAQPPPVPVKYGLPVLHYERLSLPGEMEIRVQLLDNTRHLPLTEFLNVPEVRGETYVPREQRIINGVPSVQFGQRFDPPAYGLIGHRIEMLVAIAADRLLHVDVVALPVVDGINLQLQAFDLWQSIAPVAPDAESRE